MTTPWSPEVEAAIRLELVSAERPTQQGSGAIWDLAERRDAACKIARRLLARLAEVEAERDAIKGERIISVIFGHHKGAPRPFCLYRREDVSGVSGTGVVALGAEWPDGLVVLRWTSAWPTSVVFHDRGIDSIKAIHGHDGRTEVVWLSDELPALAEMETERDDANAALAAETERLNSALAQLSARERLEKAARALLAAEPRGFLHKPGIGRFLEALGEMHDALDALGSDGTDTNDER